MSLTVDWQGFPYYPISRFYRHQFGEKVYKIPVTTAETCPNRQGLNGMKTCNFCDVYGSAAYPEMQVLKLEEQIEKARERVKMRVNANKFLVYFQAYTTTYARVGQLRQQFEVSSKYDDVVGVVVGTRPDCISDSLFDLWNDYTDRFFVSVEFGVQSFNEEQLLWMRRGHTARRSVDAILRTAQKTKVNLGIHLIFGNPGETLEQIELSARLCNTLPIHNVKLHNLHVLKNTPLADDYADGKFQPLSREDYTERVAHFLKFLNPNIAVHRLSALASRHDELIAPAWTNLKMESYQGMLDQMNAAGITQGLAFDKADLEKDPYDILKEINP